MQISSPPAVRVRAHAKINVSLRVLARRTDGYHELRTVFQSLTLHDTILISRHAGPLRVTTTDSLVPGGRDNIVWHAVDLLWRTTRIRGRPSGLHIHIVKHIPAGGGLGGGSSDAAAVLRALASMWRLTIDPGSLENMARTLGADVPFFLHGGTALGVERGDRVFPLPDLPRHWTVLALPGYAVATGSAFAWFDRLAAAHPGATNVVPDKLGHVAAVRNDLERAVGAHHPDLLRIKRRLLASGASAAALTGSGSTVFGLFPNESSARSAAVRLGCQVPTVVTRFLPRSAYTRLARPGAAGRLPRGGRIG